jgi:hypothetical protein
MGEAMNCSKCGADLKEAMIASMAAAPHHGTRSVPAKPTGNISGIGWTERVGG